jgi:hypothetical protein
LTRYWAILTVPAEDIGFVQAKGRNGSVVTIVAAVLNAGSRAISVKGERKP